MRGGSPVASAAPLSVQTIGSSRFTALAEEHNELTPTFLHCYLILLSHFYPASPAADCSNHEQH